jgi:hypothetical protein
LLARTPRGVDAHESGLKRGEQIDRIPVWIMYLRVALAPERVPRLLDTGGAGVDQLAVHAIDVVHRITQEGDPNSGATRRWGPLGSERLDRLLGVDEKPEAAGQCRLDVSFGAGLVGKLKAELSVERDRYVHVRDDHTNGIEFWHRSTVASDLDIADSIEAVCHCSS